jgi:hypothetical protein
MFRCVRLAVLVFAGLAAATTVAYAQASITGVVRDTSGAVLPGVTVEATSPALIERVRASVTDGTGQYRIENLRPGEYVVTFTLPGFATVRREGIELTGTFTATVNGELRVGAVEETVTVTGETPVVDVQNTVRQRVLDQEILDAVPSSRVPSSVIMLLPGVTNSSDVGGMNGDGNARDGGSVRGNSDVRALVGGVSMAAASGSSGGGNTVMNIGAYQEMAVDTGGFDVEQKEGGIRVNLIPRDGGNTFSGRLFTTFANSAMQGNNFTQELKGRGLGAPNSLNKLWEVNPSFGGPIRRDKLWFHWTMRHAGAYTYAPMFYNKNAGDPTKWTYEPDTSRPAYGDRNTNWNFTNLRLTWQATSKNKLGFVYDPSKMCDCPRGANATTAPESNENNFVINRPKRYVTGDWTAPVTSRLLLEASFVRNWIWWARAFPNPELPPGAVNMVTVVEQSTGLRYRATATGHQAGGPSLFARTAMSYITGAHALKVGFNFGNGTNYYRERSPDAPIEYRFNNGVPNRLTLHARETNAETKLDADHGLFVQDRWTVDRLTLTGGLRFDIMHVSYPAIQVRPTTYAPDRDILLPPGESIRWQDFSPRGGVAYDIFGDGKTALKASLGKYLIGTYLRNGSRDLTGSLSPALRLVSSTTRSWNDANRNYVPDCDLLNRAANGECGAMANPNFGRTGGGTAVDPDLLTGWGKRLYNWQFDVGVQRELLPRVSLSASYWRSSWGNHLLIDNRSVGPADFDPFSITAPRDPRLPDGGGYLVSGLYDLKPSSFGRPADNVWTFAHKFGKQTEVWNGVDVNIDARPGRGMLLQGGATTQRQTTDNCEVAARLDNPSQLFCHVTGTFLTQIKFVASYLVPGIDVQVTSSIQSIPGPQITASYVASLAEVQPSLGRPLAGGERNITVSIVEPRTMYGERRNQVDLRIGKILRFGNATATPSVDVYNLFNSNAVLELNSAFATWQRPDEILTARFAKIGLQLTF